MKTLRRLTLALGLTIVILAVPEPAHAGYTSGTITCPVGQAVVVTFTAADTVYVSVGNVQGLYTTVEYHMGSAFRTWERWYWPSDNKGYGWSFYKWAVLGLRAPTGWSSARCVGGAR